MTLTIEVLSPGLFTTVQDLGRPGFGEIGVSPSGAADPLSLRVANIVLGNPRNASGLEITLQGGSFHFPRSAVIAIGGSDFEANIDSATLPLWTPRAIRGGQTLTIGRSRSGARLYLCVRGGIDVPRVLGSASTHILSGLGGFLGRPLRRGDTLPIGPEPSTPMRGPLSFPMAPRNIFRLTDAPQTRWFPNASINLLYSAPYAVTPDTNRMGLRLEGPPLELAAPREMITEGVALGAIQVPGGGKPVILFVEQQTTGGYPKIANVIAADLPALGQLKPGDEIRFKRVDFREARELLYLQEQWIHTL